MFDIDEYCYVVKFENGNYYYGHSPFDKCETDQLKYAVKYAFDWQPAKDMYLMVYLNEHKLNYNIVKVKISYEEVKE